jgi:hypothetical protein
MVLGTGGIAGGAGGNVTKWTTTETAPIAATVDIPQSFLFILVPSSSLELMRLLRVCFHVNHRRCLMLTTGENSGAMPKSTYVTAV